MSTAYHLTRVRVVEVRGLEGQGVWPDSFWCRGNVLRRCQEEGGRLKQRLDSWARAEDDSGRSYLLWESKDIKTGGLIIQPFDSCYCFDVIPLPS
jgi:hypothetical protein